MLGCPHCRAADIKTFPDGVYQCNECNLRSTDREPSVLQELVGLAFLLAAAAVLGSFVAAIAEGIFKLAGQ